MDCLWLVGQAGIAIELVGAAFIVWCSYRTKRTMENQTVTYDGFALALQELLTASVRQFRDQVWGFLMIATGLMMQFVSGLKGL
jgi:hypothetical protein